MPTLHLTVGLPGVGKTTLARQLAVAESALRLTPDEWMIPLFGGANPEHERDVLEGRFIWVAQRTLTLGTSVVLDFGCWSAEERFALRAVAERVGAQFVLHSPQVDDAERLARVERRWRNEPDHQWNISVEDQAGYAEKFTPVGPDEAPDRPLPTPPEGFDSWLHYAAVRWPSLPRLDEAGARVV